MSLLDTASLIVTPNAYKEGKLYSVIPSDGSGDLSVTRATTATRVNSAGLVELVPYNLIQYSNDLSSGWALIQTTKTLGQADPFGGNNAIKLKYNTSSSYHSTNKGLSGITGNNAHSVYAKAGELQFLQIASAQSVDEYANFNLGTGVIGTYGSLASQVQMQSVGNGWYRCSVVFTNGSNGIYCAIANSDSMGWLGANAYAGLNDTNGLFLYGAQVNQGSLKDYYPTETRLNIPRLDYSNGTCPSLLVEPQRTNLLQRSEEFNNAYWTSSATGTTVTSNTTTAPNGTLTADSINENTSNSLHYVGTANPMALSASVYTLSVYAKKGNRDWLDLSLYDGTLARHAWFNINTGVVGTIQSGVTAAITDAGNGWYRCSISMTMSASNVNFLGLGLSNADGVSTYTGNGLTACYMWGAQLELGAYATSYIPTTSASVTRNADAISKTGISSLIGQTEGTLYTEFELESGSTEFKVISISDGTTSNRVVIAANGQTDLRGFVVYGSTVGTLITSSVLSGFIKIAIAYNASTYTLFINGSQIATQSKGAFGATLTNFRFDQGNGSNNFYGNVKATALWKERLTNDQLATLTTI